MKSLYLISLCLLTTTVSIEYLNKQFWFQDGNIYHINQKSFWDIFQQYRNINRHFNWLRDEISLVNSQIQIFKSQSLRLNDYSTNQSIEKNQTKILPIKLTNKHNINILKQLSNETIFNDIQENLFEIYEFSINRTIECISMFFEQSSNKKILLIKLTNGDIDQYEMNQTKLNNEIYTNIRQPMGIENNNDKLPIYYRRFELETNLNQLVTNDHLFEIKNRPKIIDVNFFEMIGQVLRIKYHTDPSSLSCILEVFFGSIYTCDGRLIYSHELKFLSDNNNAFVFYAVMIDTQTEKQIYPIDTNSHVRLGDQIFFLFRSHPQFNTLSSFSCTNCQQNEQIQTIDKNQQVNNNENTEMKSEPDKPIVHSWISNPQNYIVYVIVTSIFLYILIGICRSRKSECQQTIPRRKSSICSRYVR